MRKSLILAALGGAILATSVAPASAQERPDWCNEQSRKNDAEWTICQNRSLWDLEDNLNNSYRVAMRELPPSQQGILRSSQADWLRGTRDDCGSDVACLRQAYRSRINTLQDVASRGHF
ncbi:MAG TPA: lysozyme inhibitor LprI family protein [Xanthobacteraceae bacterium]|nr:lysozyme inhibitor LprI family protein [Xanthobacteraceae bacterium]